MKLGYTIDFVASDGSQVRHPHHLRLRLFDDGDSRQHTTVFGEFLLDHVKELHVDLVNNLEMPWQ